MKPWAAITGAARWMTCESVSPEEAARRASICHGCGTRVVMRVRGTPYAAAFCGDPLVPTKVSCGCLVAYGTGATATTPAGKVTCRGEQCPQGRW